MSNLLSQPVTLACPICGAPIQAEIHSLVDVGQEPELKTRLLRGRLNVARCTNCGGEGVIAAPLLYHDPEKELLLAFIPPESELSDEQQQRIIGDLTNMIMSYLPPEQRKGYLLIPKVLLSYQSLLEAILHAEGISEEVMASHRARVELADRLLAAMGDESGLASRVAEVEQQLDFEFFATLGVLIETARQDGHEDYARKLEGLREQLLEKSSYGRKLMAQMLAQSPDRPPLAREELLDKILAASSEEELSELVTWYRSAVDYSFFQMLTERLERADQEGDAARAQQLRELRETLLDLTDRLDEQAQAALERATVLLRQLLGAEEPEALVRERLNEFDDAFFIVLGANLQAAQAAGREEAYQRLQELGNLVLQIAQERLPPEVRLVRRLLDAPDDESVRALLEKDASLVDENLVRLMQGLADDVKDEEAAEKLRRLAEQAERWLEEQG